MLRSIAHPFSSDFHLFRGADLAKIYFGRVVGASAEPLFWEKLQMKQRGQRPELEVELGSLALHPKAVPSEL